MRLRASLGLVFSVAGTLGSAQQVAAPAAPGASPQVPSLTIQSQLVLVPTEVRTKKGENIYGLQAGDFSVEADGIPQRVRLDSSDSPVPLSVMVLVQCSRTALREGPQIKGLATMVDAMVGGAPARVAVADFGTDPELLTGLTADPEQRNRAFSLIEGCPDDGGVGIFDALSYANRLLDKEHATGRRLVLLVSETRDHGSKAKPAGLVEALNRSNTVVYSVAFSPAREAIKEDLKTSDGAEGGILGLALAAVQALRKNAPKEFARETGGEYINFGSENAFDQGLNSLANRVHNGYELSFVPHFPPNSPSAAPGLHTLKVSVPKYPDAVVQYREAYWAAPPGTVAVP
jgi:VWFA-related protein